MRNLVILALLQPSWFCFVLFFKPPCKLLQASGLWDWDILTGSCHPFSFPCFLPPGPSFLPDFIPAQSGSGRFVSCLVRGDASAAPFTKLFGYLCVLVIHGLLNCTVKGALSAHWEGLPSPAAPWSSPVSFEPRWVKGKAWGRKSQKTLGEWNFRNGESELVPAWSSSLGLAEGFFWLCRLVRLFTQLPFKFQFSFSPAGLFYCTLNIFFFFFALHKVLTHVANGCVLVKSLIILEFKIDHFCVGFYFKPE